jgi:cell division protein FtsB
MRAIDAGKVPQVPSSVAPVLRQVIERGWALDPKQRPTIAQVCEILSGADWCVFPGADAIKVAEAELELPIDVTASPATVALRVGKLEAAISGVKSENATLKSENVAVKGQVTQLQGEVSRLMTENATMKAGITQIPVLRSENATMRSEIATIRSENTTMKSEVANLKAEFARMKQAPAPAPGPVQQAGAPSSGPVQPANAAISPGTLLTENAQAVESLPVKLQVAELLLSKGAGRWPFDEFKAKVIGKAPLLVIVEFAGGVCGGFAAVPFQDKMDENVADPTGASFVFSLRPTPARYQLQDKAKALYLSTAGDRRGYFMFGFHCLSIDSGGDMIWCEYTYAVPSGWKTSGRVKFTRFEVWRVTS